MMSLYYLFLLFLLNFVHGNHRDTLSNSEKLALEIGKVLIQDPMKHYASRKPLLLATFVNLTNPLSRQTLQINLETIKFRGEWVIIYYDGQEKDQDICQTHKQHILHCAPTTIVKGDMSVIPKPLFYTELLPFLPSFQYIYILDEDISFEEFRLTRYQHIHQCAFHPAPPPLISQSLVTLNDQKFTYLNKQSWESVSGIVATEIGLVEQQAPYFHSLFLQWFIQTILPPTLDAARRLESSWGMDLTWCNAAYSFAKDVMRYDMRGYVPCALLILAPPLRHLNGRTMKNKVTNRTEFESKGLKMFPKFRHHFPTWFDGGKVRYMDPLELKYNFTRSFQLPSTCTSRSI